MTRVFLPAHAAASGWAFPLARHLALLMVLLAAGCAHYPVNAPLDRYDPAYGYRIQNATDTDDSSGMLMVVTFSGGGTRAAALAYGVLEQLAKTEIVRDGRRTRLLDEIDIISSVSGGSFTAAYYALRGDDTFRSFEGAFLKRDVQGAITRNFFKPANLARMTSPTYGRIDLVAEYLDENLFHGATYGDLISAKRRPFVLINASDMSLGARFEFTQDQFDLLCSDLSRFPLARAVAASSAVPVVFSPLALRNYAGRCGYREPEWVALALQNRASSARRFNRAAEIRSYLDPTTRPFIHLLDGGMTDNLGLRGMLDRVISREGPWSLARSLGAENIRKAVMIIVSAETGPDFSQDRSEQVPTLSQVLRAIKDVPINRYSFETTELLKSNVEDWTRRISLHGAAEGRRIDSYVIEISFDALHDEAERQFFTAIPTSFALPADTVDALRRLAARLLEDSADYQRLLRDLAAE
ncbi:MAG: patatin-like phospholipase family protein [Pseudomonadota bacterium]